MTLEEDGHLPAKGTRRESLKETNPANTSVSDVYPPDHDKINFCCFSVVYATHCVVLVMAALAN